MAGSVNDTHAAAAELAEQFVAGNGVAAGPSALHSAREARERIERSG